MRLAYRKYLPVFAALLFALLLLSCDGGVSQELAHVPVCQTARPGARYVA
jgi:hypothetical protein